MKEFEQILREHRSRYPKMEPQDYGKLAFQSEFGPEHLVSNADAVMDWLKREWGELPASVQPIPPEPIGNGLCRFHLSACTEEQLPLLAELFCRSAREHRGNREGLLTRLELIRSLKIPGMEQWLTEYEAAGYPAVRHSQTFRDAYGPAYRVIRLEYADRLL